MLQLGDFSGVLQSVREAVPAQYERGSPLTRDDIVRLLFRFFKCFLDYRLVADGYFRYFFFSFQFLDALFVGLAFRRAEIRVNRIEDMLILHFVHLQEPQRALCRERFPRLVLIPAFVFVSLHHFDARLDNEAQSGLSIVLALQFAVEGVEEDVRQTVFPQILDADRVQVQAEVLSEVINQGGIFSRLRLFGISRAEKGASEEVAHITEKAGNLGKLRNFVVRHLGNNPRNKRTLPRKSA